MCISDPSRAKPTHVRMKKPPPPTTTIPSKPRRSLSTDHVPRWRGGGATLAPPHPAIQHKTILATWHHRSDSPRPPPLPGTQPPRTCRCTRCFYIRAGKGGRSGGFPAIPSSWHRLPISTSSASATFSHTNARTDKQAAETHRCIPGSLPGDESVSPWDCKTGGPG